MKILTFLSIIRIKVYCRNLSYRFTRGS